MKHLLISFGLLSFLIGCSQNAPATRETSGTAPAVTSRFIPVSGNNPYVMFDEETAQACWSGPIAEASSNETSKTTRKDGIDFKPLPAQNPHDPLGLFSSESVTEQPTGKFAEDAKGIPTCRQLVGTEAAKSGKNYPTWFHPIPSAPPNSKP